MMGSDMKNTAELSPNVWSASLVSKCTEKLISL
jgi:hypothetical protein